MKENYAKQALLALALVTSVSASAIEFPAIGGAPEEQVVLIPLIFGHAHRGTVHSIYSPTMQTTSRIQLSRQLRTTTTHGRLRLTSIPKAKMKRQSPPLTSWVFQVAQTT